MTETGLTPPIAFHHFLLDPGRRLLTAAGKPVALSPRGFDILALLVERRDRVVTKDEIMAEVWRGTIVEENNLAVQISGLRRALGVLPGGAQIITTVPGRGYRFVAPIGEPQAPAAPVSAPARLPEAASSGPLRPASQPICWRCRAILALGLLGLAMLAWRQPWRSPETAAPPRLSIVVLPFRNLGDDPDRDTLADAITDDLTTDLSHMPGSVVIARTSADIYKGRAVPVEQIGRALNVRYVLEGSVRSTQGTLRVNAQLIDASTGAHLWAERYDAGTARLWDAQTDIVRHIASGLDRVLLHTEVARAALERPGNQDALDLFFSARSVMDRGDLPEQMTEAQRLLKRAIVAEPDFVDALAALGWLLTRKLQTYDYPDYMRDADEADRVIAHALAIAPDNPAVLAAHGRLLAYHGRCTEAAPVFAAALAAEPNNLAALAGTANCAWLNGQPDQVAALEQTLLRLDPLGPYTTGRTQLFGLATLFGGHTGDAIQILKQTETAEGTKLKSVDGLSPAETTRLFLIAAYAMNGDLAEARRRYNAYRAIWPRRTVWRQMAFFNTAQSHMPAFARVTGALQDAGMPRFADEHEDDHLPPTSTPLTGADFAATPLSIPGGEVIDTPGLKHLLATQPAPIIVDVGRGSAIIPSALPLSDADAALDRQALQTTEFGRRADSAPDAPIVVAGTGPSGVNSYNTALHFLAAGYHKLYWYRGGEEAWAATQPNNR